MVRDLHLSSRVKITLLSDESLRLEPVPGALTIEAPTADQRYSPYHMLASALAVCTFSVLESWASNRRLSVDDLVIEVSWKFVERPHRVGEIDLLFAWPSLPADRRETVHRVAAVCPVHRTLEHAPRISFRSAA